MAIYGYPFSFLFNQMRDGADGSLAGGTVTFYAAGTTTPKAVWLDRAMTSPSVGGVLTPITLTADGTAAVFGLGLYKVVIKNASGTTVYTYDNINQIDPTYSDDITSTLVNVSSLTSPAQAQIDTKLTMVATNGTSTGTFANTGLLGSFTATNSSTGKTSSIVANSTGYLDLSATEAITFTGPITSSSGGIDILISATKSSRLTLSPSSSSAKLQGWLAATSSRVGEVSASGSGPTMQYTDTLDSTQDSYLNVGAGYILLNSATTLLRPSASAPATAASTGVVGEIRFDSNYMYRCVATNSWKRVALATW